MIISIYYSMELLRRGFARVVFFFHDYVIISIRENFFRRLLLIFLFLFGNKQKTTRKKQKNKEGPYNKKEMAFYPLWRNIQIKTNKR